MFMGTAQWRRIIIENLEDMGYQQSRFDACCFQVQGLNALLAATGSGC